MQTKQTAESRTNEAARNTSNRKAGLEMQKAVGGLRLVHVSRNVQATELREATTGRPIAVPRIWAVAEPVGISAKSEPGVAETSVTLIPQSKPIPPQPKVELAFYRKYTEAMLRRYLRLSMEVGRVPSLMGRELFRGNASHYTMNTFEDGVVFRVDVERCLATLRPLDKRVIRRIGLQGYTPEEAAPLLGLTVRTCHVRYGEALDRLTERFLAGRLLEPLKSCQEVDVVENPPSIL
jgi:Sigma-70, region 4